MMHTAHPERDAPRPAASSRSKVNRDEVKWCRCPACATFLYLRRLERNLRVCWECGHQFRLSAAERLEHLADPGTVRRFDPGTRPIDFLRFVDSKPYSVRTEKAARAAGAPDAAVCAYMAIEGLPVIVVVLDFAFMGGSVGAAAGGAIARAAQRARADLVPLLIVSASGGARMQEGAIALMQLARTAQEIARLHEAGVLCVNLNSDPTYGGATASFATLGDVIIAEPGARIGFAGPQVIKQTIRQELPRGFQTAETLCAAGLIDAVVSRGQQRSFLGRLLRLHRRDHGRDRRARPSKQSNQRTDPGARAARPAMETVRLARNITRPTTLDYAEAMLDDFVELRGDRLTGEDRAIVTGVGSLDGRTVALLGHQKGHNAAELAGRNFGMPGPAGYHKARRLMSYAAKFVLPVVALVDTPGAHPGVDAERGGQGNAIAMAIMEMSRLPVPTVVVVTGEGGSGGALAIGVGNRVLILEHAYLSVISPEGCSTILWGDAGNADRAAQALRITAGDLLRLGVVDTVIPEPPGGAHDDPAAAAANVGEAVAAALDELSDHSSAELIRQRYLRYARFGDPAWQRVLEG